MEKELQRFCEMLVTQEWSKAKSKIIFFAESNYGGAAAAQSLYRNMALWAKSAKVDLYALADDCNSVPRPGFWLSSQRKEAMMRHTRQIMDNGTLRILDRIVSSTMTDPLDKLLDQARRYSRRFKKQGRPEAEEPKQSSVLSGKGSGRTDDLIVILQEVAWTLPQVMNGSSRFIVQKGHVSASKDTLLHDVEFSEATLSRGKREPMSAATREYNPSAWRV